MNGTMDDLIATTSTTFTTATPPPDTADSSGGYGITYTEKVIIIVMLSLLSVVGTVGNALAIYVFSSLKQKLTSTIFILILAGTDFITCLITIPFTITMECLQFVVKVDFVCKVYHFLITATVPFSCVVIVAIAIDRYMCICHPFHHWMTIQRARIIIGVLALIIFTFASIVSLHYTVHVKSEEFHIKTTASPGLRFLSFNSTSDDTLGGGGLSYPPDHSYTAFPFSRGPGYTHDMGQGGPTHNFTVADFVAAQNATARQDSGGVAGACEINKKFIGEKFFLVFRHIHPGIFLVSCIIVLVLYSLIYRSVIAQRRKKLRIKSAQCCLLWNAANLDTPQDTTEVTQEIELSHVNGNDRYTVRQNSGAEDLDQQNNGAVRKCSLSKARIERMRVANVKTAFTLFIVTLVFIVAFLPAWLMALKILHMEVVVFYTHYVYNVVNPLIYAFLNQNFKTELRRIFRCEKR